MFRATIRSLSRLYQAGQSGVTSQKWCNTGVKTFTTTSFLCRDPKSNVNQTEGVIEVGDIAKMERTYKMEDMEAFAEISGDRNPLHLDAEYAKSTPFRKPIVYGALTFGLLSGVLASYLPGPGGIFINYTLQHPAPLFVGEKMIAEVEVLERMSGHKLRMKMTCVEPTSGKVVAKGEALVKCPASRW